MNMRKLILFLRLSIIIIILSPSAFAETVSTPSTLDTVDIPKIDNRSDRILRQMGEYLSNSEEFSFKAQISYDTLSDSGHIIQYGGKIDAFVLRPNKLLAEFEGDERHTRILLSNGQLRMMDLRKRLYSITATLPHIDEALDTLFETYGISVPISDFVYSNPYEILVEKVRFGTFVGVHEIQNVRTFHLAFRQKEIDWQIWIKAGPTPVPLKLVIDYKKEPGSPRYSVRFLNWDFAPRISTHFFEFHPPIDTTEISVLPVLKQEQVND